PAVAGHRRGAARHHPGAGAYRAAGLGAAGVAVAGAAGAAVDPRTGSAAAMACMAACAARPRDAPSLNSIWQWNGPRPGCRGPGSALREGARPVPDAAGMLHPARPLPVAGRSAAGVLALVHPRADALPLAFIRRRNSRIARRYNSSPRWTSSTPASIDGLSLTSITTGLSPTCFRSTP